MTFQAALKRCAKSVHHAYIKAVFPQKCLSCGALYHSEAKQEKNVFAFVRPGRSICVSSEKQAFFDLTADFLCRDCAEAYQPITSPLCTRCGRIFKSREGEDHLCGACISSPKRFSIARAPGVYDRTLMKTIHALKYRGKIQLAKPFGVLLLRAFFAYWDPREIDMILPVPLHVKRFRARGFNQSYILIQDWKQMFESLNLDMSHIKIERNNLIRSMQTQPQTGLGKRERRANIRNAFSIKQPESIRDKHVLLVDDVYTTGATVNECSKMLLTAGAKCVDVLTLAHAK